MWLRRVTLWSEPSKAGITNKQAPVDQAFLPVDCLPFPNALPGDRDGLDLIALLAAVVLTRHQHDRQIDHLAIPRKVSA
jgi:hypothetical protein